MSDLTVGLAILGGVVLAGVVAHGAWQARRAGPRRAEPASVGAAGPAAQQIEPVLAPAGIGIDAGAEAAEPLAVPAHPKRVAARLDALIDAIATLRPEADLAGDAELAHLPATRRAGSKAWLVVGMLGLLVLGFAIVTLVVTLVTKKFPFAP